MNRNFVNVPFAAAALLAASLSATSLHAQAAAAAPAPAAAAPAPAPVPPQAEPTKVAIIAFEQAVAATNEGQRALSDVQKKYEPKKTAIDTQAAEVEALKKKIQALPASAPDEERGKLIKEADEKERKLQRDAEEAQQAYGGDLQEAYNKVATKVGNFAVKWVQENGFTLLLNVGGSQQAPSPVLWFTEKSDVTGAVIEAYNKMSGVAAPPPAAPSATRRPTAPATTAPKK